MGIDNPSIVVLGSERFKSAPDLPISQKITLENTNQEQTEYERTVDISLEQVYDDERQASQIFRPATKFTLIFKNQYKGGTTYAPYRDYLYYSDLVQNATQVACNNVPIDNVTWNGYPQYYEFDFIRTDNNSMGYTVGSSNHQLFVNKSATTYNWTHYISYPFANDFNSRLYANDPQNYITWSWNAYQGIPFYISANASSLITFKCPMKHGLSTGNYVELPFDYNGIRLFEVYSLGDGGSGSEEYIFNIFDIGYTGSTFNIGQSGNFKRVLDPENSGETTSKYYVRVHKILTEAEEAVLVKSAYEENVFGVKTKLEKQLSGGSPSLVVLTPPTLPRTSILEGSQSYNLSFNKDIDITTLIDNQKRPITQLFFTTIWKGYYGWTNKVKKGYEFNIYLFNNLPNIWWDQSNVLSDSQIQTDTYTSNTFPPQGPFSYGKNFVEGDLMDGDYCEWNDYEQLERVISRQVNKFTFNQSWFSQIDDAMSTNKFGYYYYPHNPITLKVFSDYVEEGDADLVVGIPNYAFYSNRSNGFRWRDIYPYGFIDTNDNGVDYPFTNGKHYPFTNTIFRIFSDGSGIPDIKQIEDPTIDGCE